MSELALTEKDTGNYSNNAKCPRGRLIRLAARALLISYVPLDPLLVQGRSSMLSHDGCAPAGKVKQEQKFA